MCETQITNLVNDILRVESIEEAFNSYLIVKPNGDHDLETLTNFQNDLANTITNSGSQEQQDSAVRHYLALASILSNGKRLQLLLTLLENLVGNNTLQARMVCEAILSSDKLIYTNADFWIEGFSLVRRIIGGVDYKGVREIMKGCREKAQTLPARLNANMQPQLQVVEDLIEYIFDRNACLLPAYFIVNEIQKAYPDHSKWPHWKLARLLSSFVESFRACAQMVSIVGHSTMRPVVEHSGCAEHLYSPWRLERSTLRFQLKGSLPYAPVLLGPQPLLLRYVLEQPYSRDIVCDMLGLQKQHKQRCVTLEEQLIELVVIAMERSEAEQIQPSTTSTNSTVSMPSTPSTTEASDDQTSCHWLWLHLSSQLIYFQLFQHASFPNIVKALHDKLLGRDLRKGRDHLMWVLLQFISGSIQRNPLSNFLPVLKLYDLLYPEREPLLVPDFTKAQCTHQMAVTCIWIHLLKKAQSEQSMMQRPIPLALKAHHEFLQHLVLTNNASLFGSDYRIALLCNAYSTNQEYFSRPMAALVETILGNSKSGQTLQSSPGPTTPLSMAILDSLTVHSKMSLIHSIVTHVIKLAQTKANISLAPALVETYSRLLVYTEIESLGIKGFISQLLPNVFKSQAWGTLYTLLEMFSYRMHHIQPHYRVQLLSHLHSLAAVPQTNQTQLHLCVESTALRLITGLGSREVQPQLQRFLQEPKTLVSAESEELNRALVLTLARSMHVTGTGSETLGATWCKELLNTIMQNTPHSWANHTLDSFPPVLNEFFKQNIVAKENKQQLKKAVEEEYRNWTSINNENDIITHFSVPGTPPLFLCLLWKMILETDRITPIAYKILERIGARALSAHLRKFCDCLVFEFTNSPGGSHVNKCVDTINDMIWKYNIVTIDRLVLCLALRTQEGSEAQVCFFIIQLLLLKAAEFRSRVHEFVKENSPEHWKQSNWYDKHLAFHRKYPEKFAPEEQSVGGATGLPVLFGNVCLRFLPVFDIVIHRYLEIPPVIKSLEILLEHLGCLYKFHDRPVTYLYNTLHYYERKLRERPSLKRKLVAAVLGSLKDIRPPGWALSDAYQHYLQRPSEDISWIPELDYYMHVVRRVVETMAGDVHFPVADWRFNEFPNAGAHALYVTCVELMALPVGPSLVANSLLDVVIKGCTVLPQNQLHSWINAIGVIMSALPESYWMVLHERLIDVLSSSMLQKWVHSASPFQLFNLEETSNSLLENTFSNTLALAHSIWHHAGWGQLASVPLLIKEKLGPLVRTEPQLLFICHLIGPFLQRFTQERHTATVELTMMLYELLAAVDQASTHLSYMDPICDLLYHIKYMFVGDSMKTEVEGIIRRLRPALQMRLRFIAHLSVEEINSVCSN